MKAKLNIPGELPGLNEIIDASKNHFGSYASMKEFYTDMIAWLAYSLPQFENPIKAHIVWYARTKRRDPDNVMAGQKFIFDGLVKAGKIQKDTWKFIQAITHDFQIDRQNPRIEVEIEEVGKLKKQLTCGGGQ
jgi:Holliday junction resolvase RusA-like endonuclease